MPPIVLTVLQWLFLLLLYVFVARAVRAVLRDTRVSAPARTAPRQASRPAQRREKPRPRRAPSELVVHISEGRPRVVPLNSGDVVFGRSQNSTVVLTDPYTSDHHARVYRDGDDWVLVDLGSTNGTFINQVKVTAPTPISAGDQLGIGRTVVEVRK